MWWAPTGTYLAHHGILGMKWGVRRYQNPDGSLTAAGKARYYKNDIKKGYRDEEGGITEKGINERASKDELYKIAKSYQKQVADMGDNEDLMELGELCVMELSEKYGNASQKDFYKIAKQIKMDLVDADPNFKKALDIERELSEVGYAFYNGRDTNTADKEWGRLMKSNKRLNKIYEEQTNIVADLATKYHLDQTDVYWHLTDLQDAEHWKSQQMK